MKFLVVLMLAGLAYGVLRLAHNLIRELAEITAESWHVGDS